MLFSLGLAINPASFILVPYVEYTETHSVAIIQFKPHRGEKINDGHCVTEGNYNSLKLPAAVITEKKIKLAVVYMLKR